MSGVMDWVRMDSARVQEMTHRRGLPPLCNVPAVRKLGWVSPDETSSGGSRNSPASEITVCDELSSDDSENYEDDDDDDDDESSNDSEYDTDLDLHEDVVDPAPHTGVVRYETVCDKNATAPQRAIIRALPTSTIKMAHRALGPIAMKPLAAALMKNTVVQKVDLTDNGIESTGAVYIAEMLKTNEFITEFDLTDNAIGTRGAEAIGIMMAENRGLVRLSLSGNDFSDEKAAAFIGDGILCNDRIVDLDLSNNDMNERGAAYIGLAFRENISIEHLNISWNKLRQRGTVSLCAGIQLNRTLTHLDVSWNGLGYGGALALKTVLQANATLVEIDASNNGIGWEGALLISEGLQHNQSLEVLRLGHNVLTTTGCMDLIEATSKNNCLSTLDLTGVPVIAEFELMSAAIRQTRRFKGIHGGLVNSHDKLGQRHGRRAPAMQRVIDYMKTASIRTSELVRSFDKRGANNIDMEEFVRRIRQSGIDMQRHELRELLSQIASTNRDSVQNINYQLMAQSVNAHIQQERKVKIKDRQRLERKESYHASILHGDLPPIVEKAKDEKGRTKWSLLKQSMQHGGLHRESSHGSGFSSDRRMTLVDELEPMPRQKTKILSMATTLGGKAVKFGAAGVKKKKKKKRKSKSKSKSKKR